MLLLVLLLLLMMKVTHENPYIHKISSANKPATNRNSTNMELGKSQSRQNELPALNQLFVSGSVPTVLIPPHDGRIKARFWTPKQVYDKSLRRSSSDWVVYRLRRGMGMIASPSKYMEFQ